MDDILDLYLDWVEINRAPATYKDHRSLLRDFNGSLTSRLRVCDLKPFHVSRWLDSHDSWGDTMKNRAAGVVKRSMSWAEEQGLITHSPIAKFKAPPKRSSDIFVSSEMWADVQKVVKPGPFLDYLTILWETGCRPIEARIVERRHVRADHWQFPKIDSKGQKYNRIVWLSDTALTLCVSQMDRYRTGPLFRNRNGKPWTKDAITLRFKRLSKKIGARGQRQGISARVRHQGA